MILPALYLAQLVFSKASKCIPVDSTSACAPWSSGLHIDSEKLSEIYGAQVKDAAAWEALVLQTTSGGDPQKEMWKYWAGCDAYTGTLLQYDRSYVCLTDLFHYSEDCNKEVKVAPMCADVCDEYIGAAKLLLESEYCATLDQYSDEVKIKYLERRKHVMNGIKGCRNLASASYFNDTKCFSGIKSDESSCGFGGNTAVGKAYCKEYPKDSCCSRIEELPVATETPTSGEPNSVQKDEGFIARVKGVFKLSDTDDEQSPSFYHRAMMAFSVDNQSASGSSVSSSGIDGVSYLTIAGVIGAAALIIIGLGYMVVIKYHGRSKSPVSEIEEHKMKNDGTYVPFIVDGQTRSEVLKPGTFFIAIAEKTESHGDDELVFQKHQIFELIKETENPDWFLMKKLDSNESGVVHKDFMELHR